MNKLKNLCQNNKGKIIIILSIVLSIGIITIVNVTIKTYKEIAIFISNPIPVYAVADVEMADKDYAYNDKVPVEVIKEEIRLQAREYGIDEQFMLSLAFCESSYNNLAKNPSSTALGTYQWLVKSWEQTDSFKLHKIARTDYKANITEAMKAIKRGEQWRWKSCLK